jgi:hypothetical protein
MTISCRCCGIGLVLFSSVSSRRGGHICLDSLLFQNIVYVVEEFQLPTQESVVKQKTREDLVFFWLVAVIIDQTSICGITCIYMVHTRSYDDRQR